MVLILACFTWYPQRIFPHCSPNMCILIFSINTILWVYNNFYNSCYNSYQKLLNFNNPLQFLHNYKPSPSSFWNGLKFPISDQVLKKVEVAKTIEQLQFRVNSCMRVCEKRLKHMILRFDLRYKTYLNNYPAAAPSKNQSETNTILITDCYKTWLYLWARLIILKWQQQNFINTSQHPTLHQSVIKAHMNVQAASIMLSSTIFTIGGQVK